MEVLRFSGRLSVFAGWLFRGMKSCGCTVQ